MTSLRYAATLLRGPSIFARAFSLSAVRSEYHFDTHHFVQRLEREGLTREQAEGIMSALSSVIEESARNMTAHMVSKGDYEKVRQRVDMCL